MEWDANHIEGAVCLVWAGVALTAVLLKQPKTADLVRRWKEKNEYEKSNLVFHGGLVGAFAAWMLVTVGTGNEVVAVVGLMCGSVFFLVLGTITLADRIKKRRHR